MLRCGECKKGINQTRLIVIKDKYYCFNCLKRIIRIATKGEGRYYTHVQDRIFISFRGEYGGINIEEFKLSELMCA